MGDVGTSKTIELSKVVNAYKTAYTMVGTKSWMAPEMIEFEKLADDKNKFKLNETKLDTFSLGLLCLFLLNTEEFKKTHLKKSILNLDESFLQDFLKNYIKPRVPLSFYLILRSMLTFNPLTRYDTKELFSDFSQYLKERVNFNISINRLTYIYILLFLL